MGYNLKNTKNEKEGEEKKANFEGPQHLACACKK